MIGLAPLSGPCRREATACGRYPSLRAQPLWHILLSRKAAVAADMPGHLLLTGIVASLYASYVFFTRLIRAVFDVLTDLR